MGRHHDRFMIILSMIILDIDTAFPAREITLLEGSQGNFP
jgi:hypothetical protein